MVVDDEPLVLRAAERALRRHCDVACVASGGEALRLLASDPPPDFILCDLMMPEMTGMDLYDHISWRFPALERRIFFATGGPFTPRARAFAEKMGSRVLDKPFSGPDLVALIAKHVGKAR
jgi:CheY-like chemotaxis protein